MIKLIEYIKTHIRSTIAIGLITIFTTGINSIIQLRKDFINLKNIVNTMKGTMMSNRLILEGEYYVIVNEKEIPAFIMKSLSQDLHVFVEDGGSTIYGVCCNMIKKEYYYINYKGQYITIYCRK